MKKFLLSLLLVAFASTSLVVAQPSTADAACNKRFFGTVPAWYNGVAKGGAEDCDEVSVDAVAGTGDKAYGGKLGAFLMRIAFNIVEILMNVAAYVAVAFIIVGGFKYLTSMGSDGNAKGRKTIINACVGLLLSILSIGIINFVTANL